MPNTYVDYTGDNTTTSFAFPFPYLDDTHVVVQLDTVALAGGKFVDQTVTTHYTIQTSPSAAIIFVTAPATGDRIRIKRDSASDIALVDFENGSVLTEVELDRAYLHNLYLSEEIEEGSGKNVMTKDAVDGSFDADLAKIKNLADPTNPQDAVTKNYADTTFVDEAGDTMTGNLDMVNNSKVVQAKEPSAGNDLTNKTYVDEQDALQVTKTGDNMTGDLAMDGNMVSGLGAPISSDHSARKGYVDQQDLLQVTKAGDSMSGNLDMQTNDIQNVDKVTGLISPASGSHATNKTYVDAQIATTLATGTAGGPINTVNISDAAITTNKINDAAITADKLADTAVTPGSYTATNLTVDAQGRITAAANGSASPSAADVKTLYESNANTNEYDDAEQTKLAGIAAGATANDTDSNLKNRANHTGTQTAATISDFDTEVANNTDVAANTAKVSNATHTGDVTGSTSLTIASGVVTAAKLSSTDTELNYVNSGVGIGTLNESGYDLTATKVKLKGTATQLFFEDTDEAGTPTEIAMSLNAKALRFGFQDAPSTQAFAVFGRNLTLAGGTVAEMNALTAADGALEGQVAVVSNGNSGSICLAMYTGVAGSGGSWKVLATPGAAISA